METVTVTVQVTTRMSNLPRNLGFISTTSAVSIDLHEEIKELIEDETGIRHVASHQAPSLSILLRPRSFTPLHLSRLLREREIPFRRYLSTQIALCRCSRANFSRQTPFLISVNVNIIKEVRFVVVPSPSVSVSLRSGASGDVFRRLVEEQSVELSSIEQGEEEEDTCSICIDKLLSESSSSENEIHQNIIRMPRCLHLFHQNCIFEWLSRHNSCPLCRRIPYEEDQETGF